MEEAIEGLTLKGTNITDSSELDFILWALECPFNWNLQNLVKTLSDLKLFIAELESKLKENDKSAPLHDFDEDQWYKLTILLLLAYILQMENDSKGALQTMDELETIINKLDDDNKNNSFLYEIKPALVHIILATKAHLVKKSDVSSLIEAIHPVASMSKKEQAGIQGVKSEICLLLGYEGHQLAITYAEEAIKLNNKESHWWFLAGNAMGRVRRLNGKWDLAHKKELDYLEKAKKLKNSPSYAVILAQSCREYARNAFFASKNGEVEDNALLRTNINNMNKKSLELYKFVIDARANSPRTLIRCAQGLLKLPYPFRDVETAKKLIDNCLELSPENPYVHHVAAILYENHRPFQNYKKALKHLKDSSDLGNWDATMHMIQLKSKLYETYDQYDDLNSAKRFTEEAVKLKTAKEIGAYNLFKKRDITSALKDFSFIVKEDKGSLLESTFIVVYPTNKPINLLNIVVDETRLALEKCNSQEKIQLQSFLDDIGQRFPGLLLSPPTSGQIDDVITSSRYFIRKYRY